MTLTFDPRRAEVLQATADDLINRQCFAGMAWQVCHGDRVVSEGVSGTADHALAKPLGRDAIYRIYSMTKPIVSVAVLQYIEAGKLQLDDRVERWIPGFATSRVLHADGRLLECDRAVTIEDLLTHRSGLSYDFLPDCAVATLYREELLATDGSRPLAALVERLANLPLAHQPGSAFWYSYATDVLAHVLELVSAKPLREVLREALLLPLGMTETDFGVSDASRSRLVAMHGLRDLGETPPDEEPEHVLRAMSVEKSYPSDQPETFARGGLGLFSTLQDYSRFSTMLLDGHSADGEPLLSAPMLDLLGRNRLPPEQRPIAVGRKPMPGYGWGLIGRVMTDPGDAMHLSAPGEGGWSGAASTWFWVDRAQGITGIVLTQYLGASIPLGQRMMSAAYQGFVVDART